MAGQNLLKRKHIRVSKYYTLQHWGKARPAETSAVKIEFNLA